MSKRRRDLTELPGNVATLTPQATAVAQEPRPTRPDWDYTMAPNRSFASVTVDNIEVQVLRTLTGVLVRLYPVGEGAGAEYPLLGQLQSGFEQAGSVIQSVDRARTEYRTRERNIEADIAELYADRMPSVPVDNRHYDGDEDEREIN